MIFTEDLHPWEYIINNTNSQEGEGENQYYYNWFIQHTIHVYIIIQGSFNTKLINEFEMDWLQQKWKIGMVLITYHLWG